MKATRLVLCLLILTFPALADSVSDSVSVIQRNTALLASKARPEGVTLTWGQDLAAQDLERLAKAAAAIPLDQSDDLSALVPLVNEMATAAARVRSTAEISILDEEGRALALATADQAKLLQQNLSAARRQAEDRAYAARRYYDYGPRFSIGLGFGSGWYPYGWGWGYPVGIYRPYWGWGRCR